VNRFLSWYGIQPPAIRALLTINVVLYVAWLLVLGRIDVARAFVFDYLALNPNLPDILYMPWQVVTYNFLHLGLDLGGLLHILFNMLWLVWIGREFEQMQGSHRLMAIYLISGIGGGLVTVAFFNLVAPGAPVVVYGASGSVLGVMAAVATFYPYQSVGLLFIGSVRLVYLVIAVLVIDILFRMGSSTAVSAHIGGALFGFLFAKAEKAGLNLSSWAGIFFGGSRSRSRRRGAAAPARQEGVFGRVEDWFGGRGAATAEKKRPATVHPMPRAQAEPAPKTSMDREVDRILDKISADGYESLSDEEKKLLYEASRR
jgi:membrane associated rhomboid family serine protease